MIGTDSQASMRPGGGFLAFLLSAAAWQDSLLQSYRTQLLSSQAFLFAFGAALLVADLSIKPAVAVWAVSILVLAIAIGGGCAYWQLQSVLRSRSEDVDFWHVKLILCERKLPVEERVFTSFKRFQWKRELPPDERHSDQDPTLDELARAGLGYSRRVIAPVVAGTLLGAWTLLALGALALMVLAIV